MRFLKPLYRLVGACLILMVFVWGVSRVFTPYFTQNMPRLASWVETQIPYPIEIGQLKIAWEGLHPAVTMRSLSIYSEDKTETIASFDKVSLALNIPRSLVYRKLQFDEVFVKGADLSFEVHQHKPGVFKVSGIPVFYGQASQAPQEGIESSWLDIFKRIVVINSDVQFTFDDGRTLPLTSMGFELKNKSDRITFRGTSTLAGEVPTFFRVGGKFDGDKLREQVIHGKLYVEGTGVSLDSMQPLLNRGFLDSLDALPKLSGQAEFALWLNYDKGDLTEGFLDLNSQALAIGEGEKAAYKAVYFDSLEGQFLFESQENGWHILGQDVKTTQPLQNTTNMDFNLWFDFPQGQTHTQDQGELKKTYHFTAHHLDLKAWLPVLLQSQILSEDKQKVLSKWSLSGTLPYVVFQYDVKAQSVTSLQAILEDIGFAASQKMPGLEALSGFLNIEDKTFALLVDSQNVQLTHPDWFKEKMNFDRVQAYVEGDKLAEGFWVSVPNFQAMVQDAFVQSQAQFLVKTQNIQDVAQNEIFLEGEILMMAEDLPTKTLLAYLPQKKLSENLNTWLDKSIVEGLAKKTTLVWRGPFSEFPFSQNQGVFQAYSELEQVQLDYVAGWPVLKDMQANVMVRNEALEIKAKSAKISQGAASKMKAHIPDLFSADPNIVVTGNVETVFSDGLAVIDKSPLQASLGESLRQLQLSGPFDLSLGLDIPLKTQARQTTDMEVEGVVHAKGASLNLSDWGVLIENIIGPFHFTDNDFQAKDLKGTFLHLPTTFEVETKNAKTKEETFVSNLQITAKGKMDVQEVFKTFDLPIQLEASGLADYKATLVVPQNQEQNQNKNSEDSRPIQLSIETALFGVGILAPPPFEKRQDETRTLTLDLVFEQNGHVLVSGQYGQYSEHDEQVFFEYHLAKKESNWQILSGAMHFGEKPSDSFSIQPGKLMISGELFELDMGVWQAYFNKWALEVVGIEDLRVETNISIQRFLMLGVTFENVQLMANNVSLNNAWQLHFNGQDIVGVVDLPTNRDDPIHLDFQWLSLQPTNLNFEEKFQLGVDKNSGWYDKPIEVKVAHLHYKDLSFHDVTAHLLPTETGYDIDSWLMNSDSVSFDIKGALTTQSEQSVQADQASIHLMGSVKTEDFSKALRAFNQKSTIQEAKGEMDFDLRWFFTQEALLTGLEGYANVVLREGYIKGVEPGIGRLLGLLNLDSIQRRLRLDFSDVSKDGFFFDEFSGQFTFAKGSVSTNNLKILGASANIELMGDAGLKSKKVNAKMVVMPNVTGSLPLAVAIAAGNPIVGAAVWVADKIIGPKIQKMTRYTYRISGTWEDLEINEVT